MLTAQYVSGKGYTLKLDGRVVAHGLSVAQKNEALALGAVDGTCAALLAVIR